MSILNFSYNIETDTVRVFVPYHTTYSDVHGYAYTSTIDKIRYGFGVHTTIRFVFDPGISSGVIKYFKEHYDTKNIDFSH